LNKIAIMHAPRIFWQGRYKSFAIEDDDHLMTVVRYVEGNPVRAGLVETAPNWVWSSHRERCGLESKGWLTPLPVELPTDWTTFVDTPLTGKELAKVKRNMERQTARRDWLLH